MTTVAKKSAGSGTSMSLRIVGGVVVALVIIAAAVVVLLQAGGIAGTRRTAT